MKKKNGFTLMELLVTIAIIGVILAIVVIAVNGSIGSSTNKTSEIFEDNLKEAGNLFTAEYDDKMVWISTVDESISCLDIQNLVDFGFMEENDNVKKYIEDKKAVRIIKDQNMVSTVEIVDSSTCSVIALKDMVEVEVEVLGKVNNAVGADYKGEWTNQSVYLYARITSNANIGSFTFQWYEDGKAIAGATDSFYVVSVGANQSITKNYTVKVTNAFTSETSQYKTVESQAFKVAIDKIAPVCTLEIAGGKLGENGWYINNPKLKIVMSDNTGAIAEYGIMDSAEPVYNNLQEVEVPDTTGKVYYCFVKDAAGNVSDNNEDTHFSIKADSTAPEITAVTKVSSTCSSITLKIEATEGSSGIAGYSFDNGENWSTENTKTFTKNQTITVKVKDNAGNVAEKSHTINSITGCSSGGGGGGSSSSGGSSSGDPYSQINNNGDVSYQDRNGNNTGSGDYKVSGNAGSDGHISSIRDTGDTITVSGSGRYEITNESGKTYVVDNGKIVDSYW